MKVLFFTLLGNSALAIDLGYLKCDPDANCVVKVVKLPFGGKVIIENPVCIAARAACRLKCGPLNDDANRYIRDYESKIAILVKSKSSDVFTSQQLKLQIEQSQIQFDLTSNSMNQFKFIVQNQNLFNQTISELKSIALYFSNQQNIEFEAFKSEFIQFNLSKNTLNTILFYLEQNKKNQFNVESELKKFEYILLNPILLSQMMNQFELIEQYQLESIENMKVVNLQVEQRIKSIDQDINQLKNKIKEQEERKCPSNLL